MTIFINPGSGPVADADEAAAWISIGTFAADLMARDLHVTEVARQGAPDDGRYGFMLTFGDGRRVEVEMPGLLPEKVRYLDGDTQNIWDFPRLYIDGSSWVWRFAPEDGEE